MCCCPNDIETIIRQGVPLSIVNGLIPGLSLITSSIECDSLHPTESTALLDHTEKPKTAIYNTHLLICLHFLLSRESLSSSSRNMMDPRSSSNPVQLTSHGPHKYRSLIVLSAYTLATSLYLIAIHTASGILMITIPLCSMAWLLPDLMVIKLLGHPHPMMARILLNYVGPFSSAVLLKILLRNNK